MVDLPFDRELTEAELQDDFWTVRHDPKTEGTPGIWCPFDVKPDGVTFLMAAATGVPITEIPANKVVKWLEYTAKRLGVGFVPGASWTSPHGPHGPTLTWVAGEAWVNLSPVEVLSKLGGG